MCNFFAIDGHAVLMKFSTASPSVVTSYRCNEAERSNGACVRLADGMAGHSPLMFKWL